MAEKRDWMLKDYLTADDAKLQEAIGWQEELIREYKDSIDEAEEWKVKYEDELHRRALETFWDNNPTLLPLKIGDELLITIEFQQYKRSVIYFSEVAAFGEDGYWKLGTQFKVIGVDPINDDGNIEDTSRGGTACPYSVMVGMRRAWLEREGQ